jgi:hypothetical protein
VILVGFFALGVAKPAARICIANPSVTIFYFANQTSRHVLSVHVMTNRAAEWGPFGTLALPLYYTSCFLDYPDEQ